MEQDTRQDELIEKVFEVADEHQPDGRNHYGYDQCNCGWVAQGGTERWADHLVHLLAVEGLLADAERSDAFAELEGAFATVCAERDLAVWLHAEVQHRAEELADFAGEQANARRESDRVRNIAARECADLRDERDSARTALAEKTEYAGEKAREGDVMSLQIEDLTAERDELRTRIDTALAKLNRGGPFLPARQAAIAALQGDQSTPPETRCMNGPAKQRTLRMVEIIKALRAASTSGVLPDHLDERGSFAPMARAIVDHWPTGEADRG